MRQYGKRVFMTKDEKIRLILRQLNEEAGIDEKEDFSQWLLESSENFDLYIEMKELWDSPMKRQIEFNSANAEKRINQKIKKKRNSIKLWQHAGKIAASVIILISLGTFAYYQFNNKSEIVAEIIPIEQIVKESGAGEQLRVTLPDGSIVRLNAGSTIQFPEKFNSDYREVTLTGEAFFEVVKDSVHPFTVKSGNIMTQVLGTSFNVKAFKSENIAVTVATGKVMVKDIEETDTQELILFPNEQAVYKKDQKLFEKAEVKASNFYAWTSGVIQFNDEPLSEVINMLERWYNVSIILDENHNSTVRVEGSYKDKKLYTILDGLSFMYDLEYKYINDETITITSK